jgi:YbbR domain-containing protein
VKRFKGAILNNIGLKAFSLLLAVVIWFYIIGELNRLALEEEMGIAGQIAYKIIAKRLPIVPDIRGKITSGYRIREDDIAITPLECNVIGSKRLLDRITFVKTVPINVSEYTKPVTVRASLEPPSRKVKMIDTFATVVIPIEKIDKKQ